MRYWFLHRQHLHTQKEKILNESQEKKLKMRILFIVEISNFQK